MNLNLNENETIVKQGYANHFKGIESVGGKMFLTNQRLYFKSHSFNIQVHDLSISILEIRSLGKRNTFGIFPNGLFIELKNGKKEIFVVYRRKKWISEIEKLIRDK